MSDTPKVGDTVRYIVEGEVTSVGDYVTRIEQSDSVGVIVNHDGAHGRFEVLERADDPARDPVGTVRQWYDGSVWVKSVYPDCPWVRLDTGHSTYTGGWRLLGRENEGVRSSTVIGAVPGTSAAVAGAASAPVEITAESPEPDRSRVYVDRTGIKWARIGGGWRYLIRNRQEWNGTPFNWDEIRFGGRVRPDFPWHLSDGE